MNADAIRVLYVDDEPDLLDLGRMFLENTGYFSVSTIDSVPTALELLRQEKFDAIISDYQMPGKDGIQFLVEVRTHIGEIPFILFTGKGREEVVIQAINNGADCYLQKGGDPETQYAELSHKIKQSVSRKQSEEGLRKSEAKFQSLYMHMTEGAALHEITYNKEGVPEDYVIIETNPAFEVQLGIPRDSVIGKTSREAYGVTRPPYLDLFVRVAMTGKPEVFDTYFPPLEKHFSISAYCPAKGRFATIFKDITGQKQVNEALSAMLNGITESALLVTPEGTVLAANDTVARRLGQNCAGDLVGKIAFDFLPGDVRESRQVKIQGILQSGQAVHFEDVRDGRVIDQTIYPVKSPDGSVNRLAIFGIDITDRKRAEDALREKNRKYQLIAENTTDNIWIYDMDLNLKYISPSVTKIRGFNVEEAMHQTIAEMMTPQSLESVMQRFKDEMALEATGAADPERTVLFQTEEYCKDGSTILMENSAALIRGPDGRPLQILGISRDITGRRRAEERLKRQNEEIQAANEELAATEEELKAQFDELNAIQRELWKSEERFRLTLEATHDGIWDWSVPTGTAFFSPHWYTMLGYEPGEMPGSYATWRSLVHPDDLPSTEQKIQDSIQRNEGYSVEFRMRTKQGDWRWILTRGRVVERDSDNKPVRMVGTHTDITGRKLAEDVLLRVNQKLNILSELTRKDLSTQVFVLNSYLKLAKKHAAGQYQIIERIERSEQAAESINEIVEITRDYQDMGVYPPRWQNVNVVVLLGFSHISTGEIQHGLETEQLEIFADPLLEKAFQGLIENSLEHGGNVTRIRVWHTLTPDVAKIFFEDDGTGIPGENKKGIFSRNTGERTSVRGLFFVREILDITGITIQETGEPGKGARFEIVVPKGVWRIAGDEK